jgi:hypothetical protein
LIYFNQEFLGKILKKISQAWSKPEKCCYNDQINIQKRKIINNDPSIKKPKGTTLPSKSQQSIPYPKKKGLQYRNTKQIFNQQVTTHPYPISQEEVTHDKGLTSEPETPYTPQLFDSKKIINRGFAQNIISMSMNAFEFARSEKDIP